MRRWNKCFYGKTRGVLLFNHSTNQPYDTASILSWPMRFSTASYADAKRQLLQSNGGGSDKSRWRFWG